MPNEKPKFSLASIEVEPRNVWLCKRRNVLRNAIKACMDTYADIPSEWTEEYNALNKELR
jgi:hypothetical protein